MAIEGCNRLRKPAHIEVSASHWSSSCNLVEGLTRRLPQPQLPSTRVQNVISIAGVIVIHHSSATALQGENGAKTFWIQN
eukprot:9554-Heterococcus_DN1.PRE.2